jgi:hypothetical protein
MSSLRLNFIQPNAVKALALLVGFFALIYYVSGWVTAGSNFYLALTLVAAVAFIVMNTILADWRRGIFLFLFWLIFEDLIRKYAGNGIYIFFAKDFIIAFTYFAMFVAYRRKKLLTFKPPFLFWLGIFFWLGTAQIFNPNSPSVLYGIFGMKTYFFYVPMLFAGYAILRNEADLRKVLTLNMWIAIVVAGVGVIQSVVGAEFLNPSDMAPELYALSHDIREAPQSHLLSLRPASVFVSGGRFGFFLIFVFILAFGTAGYLLMRTKKGRVPVFIALGVVVLATLMEGQRGPFMYLLIDATVLTLALLWGAPWRQRQAFRLGKAIRLSATFAGVAILIAVTFFPEAVHARWALYTETLSPTSETSDLSFRGWQYPLEEALKVFTQPHWQFGYGIGNASLGIQYVERLTGTHPLHVGSESGYGLLVTEFGIAGPIVWTAWTLALFISAWKVVKKLKQTALFPIGFAIFWFAFMLLGPFTFYGLNAYQNYLSNAYLWLTLGMLYRLPGLLAEQKAGSAEQLAAADRHAHGAY